MSTFNVLLEKWSCPYCGTMQNGEIQFRYGPCYQYTYKLGELIDWDKPGIIYEGCERFPQGNGMVEGTAICKNEWLTQWYLKTKRILPGEYVGMHAPTVDRASTDTERYIELEPDLSAAKGEYPPVALRRNFGCPSSMKVHIEIEQDRIVKISFPDNDEQRMPDWDYP